MYDINAVLYTKKKKSFFTYLLHLYNKWHFVCEFYFIIIFVCEKLRKDTLKRNENDNIKKIIYKYIY